MLRPDLIGDKSTPGTVINLTASVAGSSPGHLNRHPSAVFAAKPLVGMTTVHAQLSRCIEQPSVARGSKVTTQALTTRLQTPAREPTHTCTARDRAQSCISTATFSRRFRLTPPTARLRMSAINLSLKEADGRIARSKVCLIKPPPRR